MQPLFLYIKSRRPNHINGVIKMNKFTVMSSMMKNTHKVKDCSGRWECLYGKDDVTVFAIIKTEDGMYLNTITNDFYSNFMAALAAGMEQYILVARRVYAKSEIDKLGSTLKDLRSAANTATEGKVFARANTRWVLAYNGARRQHELMNPLHANAHKQALYFNELPKDKDPKDGNGVRLEFLAEKENYAKLIQIVERAIDKFQDAINEINKELYK